MPDEACATSPEHRQDGQPTPSDGLVLVSTPIGNLGDLTPRARETLRTAEVILCEDTRRTARLLLAIGAKVKLQPLHEHNEDSAIGAVLGLLRQGRRVALVSDAGVPLVSDPGYRLVRAALGAGIPVSAVPGANAALTALVLSGLPPVPFLMLGFAPPRQAARLRAAERAGLAATLVWYEAPHRLAESLADMAAAFGARRAAIARELTKRFEEVRRALLPELAEHYRANKARGEFTVVVGPPEQDDPEDLDERLRDALADNTVKDAAALVATATGLPRKLVYARALALRRG